ncbi:MAG: hypothetical protein Q7R47_02925 [Candidatus Diapherotrites archaeon]|nr:hypothetical protein [Candidatus Diapherotrites archaeon]
METDTSQILKEIRSLKADIEYLKGHLVESDMLLTDEDLESIQEAEKDLKTGKTKRLM